MSRQKNIQRLFTKGDDWLVEGHEVFAKKLLEREGTDKSPNVLYVPSAKATAEKLASSYQQVAEVFGGLGVKNTTLLHQYSKTPSRTESEHKFGQANIIYIAGGDSLQMMDTFNKELEFEEKKWSIRGDLMQAVKDGKRVGGASAGQIALMGPGFSDSMSYRNPANEWDYIWVNGMKILNIANTPHLDSGVRKDATNLPPRKQAFLQAYARDSELEHPELPDTALGVTNGAMIMFDGDQAEISKVADGGVTVFHRENRIMNEKVFGADDTGLIRADLGIPPAA